MPRSERTPADYGTPELHERRTVVPELTGHGHAYRARVADDSVADALLLHEKIDLDEHGMLLQFAKDIFGAGLQPKVIPGYSGMPPLHTDPQPVSERQAILRSKVNKALQRVENDHSRVARDFLLAVVNDEKSPKTDRKLASLRKTVRTLMKFYDWWGG